MGGVTDFLFGSEEPAQQVGTASNLTRGQSDLLDQLTDSISGQIGQGAPEFGKPTVTGAAPLQQSAFAAVQDLVSPEVPRAAQAALGDLLAPFDPAATQQFFQSNVQAPALQAFQEDILPAIQESFIGQNLGRSSAARGAATDAGVDVSQGLSRQLQDLLFRGQQAATGRQQQAVGQAFGGLQLGLGAGGQQRDIEQQLLSGEFSEFLRTQPFANPALQFLGPALGTQAQTPVIQGASQRSGFLQDVAPLVGAIGGFF